MLRRSLFAIPPAFRYPAYRSYWLGMLASVSGYQVFQFGQLWLIHQLTGSPLYLGYLGLVSAIPAIALSLFGGVLADRLDKRRLILVTELVSAGLIILLATLTLMDAVRVWHVLAIAFVSGAVNAFDQPARQALYPLLIDRKAIMSAVALNSSIWQGTRIIAPAVAGLVIALAGTAAAFYLSALGFVTMAVVAISLKVPRAEQEVTGSAARNMMEGLEFIKGNSIFSFLIGMTFFNSFFGMAYLMLMPVFAVDILGVGANGQGMLLSISGVGALATTIGLSSRGNFQTKGLVLIGGAAMFGLAVAAFALTSRYVGSFPLALALMLAIGVCNSAYMISVMSSLQLMVPDQIRGRVMGFYGMTWSIMPLGGMQAGAIANFIGAPFALAIGGVAVTAFAVGPALLNSRVRNLGALLLQVERAATVGGKRYRPSPSASDS